MGSASPQQLRCQVAVSTYTNARARLFTSTWDASAWRTHAPNYYKGTVFPSHFDGWVISVIEVDVPNIYTFILTLGNAGHRLAVIHILHMGRPSIRKRFKQNYNIIWGGGSRIGAGIFLSYFEPTPWIKICEIGKSGRLYGPPGAVGGLYGSGCFHLTSKASASWNNTFDWSDDGKQASCWNFIDAHSLLSWL